MIPLNRTEDDHYFNMLQDLSSSKEEGLETRVTELLRDHSNNLIADLVDHPEHRKNYRQIGANLRESNSLKSFQSSLGYIQRIARCLENNDVEGFAKLTDQMSHLIPDLKLSTIFTKFSDLQLPHDIEEIRAISHPKIRALVIASLINRDKIPLSDLRLSKSELFQIGPHLTYLDQLLPTVSAGNFPTAEEVVDMVIQQEKEVENQELQHLNSKKWGLSARSEAEWEKTKQAYLNIERQLNDKSPPSWDVAGGLDWGMSPEEMQVAITEKFVMMAAKGRVLTEESFKNLARETFYPINGPGSKNLTRIWGADFIEENLLANTTLRVVENYLVIDASAAEIEIRVVPGQSFPNYYPIISSVENASIFSKIIHGEPKASSYRSSPTLTKLQYVDFSDEGNIREDAAGIGWVIDTEYKSFDPPKMAPYLNLIQDYVRKRFLVLTGSNEHTFNIPLSALNLVQR